MEGNIATPCSECQRLRTQLGTLQVQVDSLQDTVAQLQDQLAKARKDSSTSSKPPSSDLVKPPKPTPPDGADKRPRGGQPGHPHHQRPLFPPALLTGAPQTYLAELCPSCGHGLHK